MMSDITANSVLPWTSVPSSTLSAEALPFVPKGFVPIVSPASSEAAPCNPGCANALGSFAVEVPGCYSSLVPTPAVPFYAMQYQCAYQPQIHTFPNNETLSVPSSRIHGWIRTPSYSYPLPNTGQSRKGSNWRDTAASQQKGKSGRPGRQPASCSRTDHPNPHGNSDKRKSMQAVSPMASIDPDLSNKAEFPSLSSAALEADIPTLAPGIQGTTSVSYSTALKQQPCRTLRPDAMTNSLAKVGTTAKSISGSKTKSQISSENNGFGRGNCEELKGGSNKKKQKGPRTKGVSGITAENGTKQRNCLQNSETEAEKMPDVKVAACLRSTSVKLGRVDSDAAEKLQGAKHRNTCKQQSCDRVQPAVATPSSIPADKTFEILTLKNEISSYDIGEVTGVQSAAVKKLKGGHSYAAVLSSAPCASKEQSGPKRACTGTEKTAISKVTATVTPVLALDHSCQQEGLTVGTQDAQNATESPKPALPQSCSRPNQVNCEEIKQGTVWRQGSSKLKSSQVRVNVSKAKKEMHNSALMQNILKSQQRGLKEVEDSPTEPKQRHVKRMHRKKAPQIPDLMEDKVGVISQELLDFLQGGRERKGVEGLPQFANVQRSEEATGEEHLGYPPLERQSKQQGNLSNRVHSSKWPVLSAGMKYQALFGTYSQTAAARVVGETTSQAVSSVKQKQQSTAKENVQSQGLLKLAALGNTPVPKHMESINMKLGAIILPKRNQSTKKKGKENISTGTTKKEFTKPLTNVLDSSAPLRKRGKERELPPKKKLSVMKKIITKEREQRKQLLEKMRHAATLWQQRMETCAPLEEGISEVSMDGEQCLGLKQEGEKKSRLHSKNFREYCDHLLSREINEATRKLIGDLVFFQDRLHMKDPIKARTKRRLVYGLKEVRKYLCLNKLKCIIFAPDIEEVKAEGGLDDSMHDLIDCARKHSIPVVFAMKRRALGRCSKKKVPISCVGIFDYSGREDDFRHLLDLVTKARNAYNFATAQLNGEGNNETARSIESSFTDAACEHGHRGSGPHQTVSHDNVHMVEVLKPSPTSTAHELWDKDGRNHAPLDDGWVTTNEDDSDSEGMTSVAVKLQADKMSELLISVLRQCKK